MRYKTKKFIKRHTPALSVAAGFLLPIIGFTVFYTWQITEERNRAQMEADKARKTLQYLVEVFQHADFNQPGSSEITASQILEDGTNYINNEVNNMDIKTSLSNAIGTIFQHMGKYEKAESLLYEALKINQKRYSEDYINLAYSLYDWGGYNMTIGKHDSAEKYFTQSSAMYKRLGKKSEYANTIGELGWAYYLIGHYEKADSLLTEALEINRSIYGNESTEVAWDYQYFGWIKNGQGHHNQADSLFRRTLSIRQSELGNNHRLTAQNLSKPGTHPLQ